MNPPEKPLGFLLFLVSRAHHNCASQVFERMGIYRGQSPVLFALGRQDGRTQSELAEGMEVTPATMTNMLQRMETSGLVIRQRDSSDTRVSRVFLTESGKEALVHAKEKAQELEKIAFAGFSLAEQATVRGFLERIHANLTHHSASKYDE